MTLGQLRFLFDKPEPFLADNTAERTDEQPIQSKIPPAGFAETVNPRLRRNPNMPIALGNEGDIAHHFGIPLPVESGKGLGGDTLDPGGWGPEAPDQPEDDLLKGRIREQDEPPLQHAIERQALFRQAA